MPVATRQRLIEAAKRRFYRDGFRNVGIDAILTDVGISKAGFYKHFESKDDLMVAVLEHVDSFLQQQFRQMVREHGGPSAAGQLRSVIDVVEQVMESDEFHGCIFVNAAFEFPLPHDPAHEAALRHKRGLEDFFYELGERAAVEDPGALARELGLVIEGAYVTRAVTGESGTIQVARVLVEEVIARHLAVEKADQSRRVVGARKR
ncbi:MAG: TetR/AcrR family transcriptional regulator [Phycisphaerae bacterium]